MTGMKDEVRITKEQLDRFHEEFRGSRTNVIAMNAATANGVQAAARSRRAACGVVHQYSIRLDQKGVTNQKNSGRCWMFAALNCLRFRVMHRLKLDEFELSQNYTLFYDKLEKANYFLENILKTMDEPAGSRLLDHLLRSPMQDGGQWDMIRAVIEKYGVVPKEIMPETACSSDTKEMNGIVTEKLREDAAALRKACEAGKTEDELYDMKERMLCEVYRMLSICLGTPPERFDFERRTAEGVFIADRNLTPVEFYRKYVDMDLSQYVSLIHAPTADKPFLKSYTVDYLGNVVGGAPVKYVNVPLETMKRAAIAQLSDGEPVWFGCDVGKASDRAGGVMDPEAFDYGTLFSTDFTMTKADRLDYGHSRMTHAMVFQGVDLDADGAPVRWCVENSWGDEKGQKGMYLMTDPWFDEYMYQVVVQKKYLPEDVIAAYGEEPVRLAPWDPMGALAESDFNCAMEASPLSLVPLGPEPCGGSGRDAVRIETGARVLDDGSVRFRIYAPKAHEVYVSLDGLTVHFGDRVDILKLEETGETFPEVKFYLGKLESGLFEGVLEKEKLGGFYGPLGYTFVVDGAYVAHGYGRITYRGGRAANCVEIPDPELEEEFLIKNVPHGAVSYEMFWSEVKGAMSPVLVYTPPDYGMSGRDYPVLFLQHGGGENETGWFSLGSLAPMLDNLIADGRAEPCVVVMNNTHVRAGEEAADRGRAIFGAVERLLVEESLTYIESRYRVRKDKWGRAIAGLSMGGMQSSFVGFSHPELYGYLGIFSSSIRCRHYWNGYEDNPHLAGIGKCLGMLSEEYRVIYRGVGYQERESRPWHKEDDRFLEEIGVTALPCYHYKLHPVMCHEWGCFRRSLYDFLQLIFKEEELA